MGDEGISRRGALLGGLAATACRASETGPDVAARHAPLRAAFLRWLPRAVVRSALPISVDVSTSDVTLVQVVGVHPALWIALQDDWAINVGAEWNGRCWDLLASFDVAARPVAGGG